MSVDLLTPKGLFTAVPSEENRRGSRNLRKHDERILPLLPSLPKRDSVAYGRERINDVRFDTQRNLLCHGLSFRGSYLKKTKSHLFTAT